MTGFSPTERKALKIVTIAFKILLWFYALTGLIVIINLVLGDSFEWEDIIFITVAVLFFGNKIGRLVQKIRGSTQ